MEERSYEFFRNYYIYDQLKTGHKNHHSGGQDVLSKLHSTRIKMIIEPSRKLGNVNLSVILKSIFKKITTSSALGNKTTLLDKRSYLKYFENISIK